MDDRFSVRVHLGGPWHWKVWDAERREAVAFFVDREDAKVTAAQLSTRTVTQMPPDSDSVKVAEDAVEAMAAMRWDEDRNPDADSPAWSELTGSESMKRRYRDEARADLEEAAQFLSTTPEEKP